MKFIFTLLIIAVALLFKVFEIPFIYFFLVVFPISFILGVIVYNISKSEELTEEAKEELKRKGNSFTRKIR